MSNPPPPAPVSPRARRAGWALRIALSLFAAASLPTLARYVELERALRGRSFVERGAIGASEWRSFLARAGRPALEAEHARSDGAPRESGAAGAWEWAARMARELPPDARVFLAVPHVQLYYQGTFLWFPRRVDVVAEPALVKDAPTLAAAAAAEASARDAASAGELRRSLARAGYTHLVTSENGAIVLSRLGRPETVDGGR